MNAAQVRAKARVAMKRRADEIEADEIESGEINLIPYLDIVTNLMLFLLASISASFVLGQINTTLPDHVPASAIKPSDPKKDPNEKSLQLVVSITQKEMILWSISGLEGTIKEPKAVMERLPAVQGDKIPRYNLAKLNDTLFVIAKTRWHGKLRNLETYEVILQADGEIPYDTIIDVMDNLRRRLIPGKRASTMPPYAMPKMEKVGKEVKPIEKFDAERHPLFPDILFSMGFQ